VSLNRSEQQLFEYIQANRDERHFWEYKVREFDAKCPEKSEAVRLIERELGRYFVERSGVVRSFKEVAAREGLRPVSLKNLAEYVLRMWAPPRPVKRAAPPS